MMAIARVHAILTLLTLAAPQQAADRSCFGLLPPEPPLPASSSLLQPLPAPPAEDWTRRATILQPWGRTQWSLIRNATSIAPLLLADFGFNTLILLPSPAHNAYCGISCRLTDADIQQGADTFRTAGWHVILYTSFMHCGEAIQWKNGSINAAHPDWSQVSLSQ